MKFKPKPLHINIALAGLVLFLMMINLLVHVNPEKRNPVILDGMQRSEALLTQSEGATQGGAMVVEGTVRYGETPYRYGSGPLESEKAGRELVNPFGKNDPAAVARGKLVYERFCMACHIEKDGDPVREVVKRGVPAGPALLSARVAGFKDGYIFNYVTKGGALMPAHGPQIPEEDRWKVVAYIRHRMDPQKEGK